LELFRELRRRHVIKVAAAYVVTAWLILQVCDVVLGNIGAPDWVFKVILLLLCVGLPVVLVLAWAFDLTPGGLVRTEPEARGGLESDTSDNPDLADDNQTTPGASVAVLPFVNMSGDPENEYFSDGLSEELLNVLANINSLKVAARTSSFHFKGRTGSVASIAKRLGVATILEGSVRQSGDRVRITAQLISAADGYHLWSETYDRELIDIFAVQDEIASAVASALKVRLLGPEPDSPTGSETDDAEAFKFYLKGMHSINRGSDRAALESAVSAFQAAIEIDPGYAKAFAALAHAWDQMATNSFIKYEDGATRGLQAASKAIELDPGLAYGYLVKARMLLHYKLDQHGARQAIGKAVSLNAGNAEVQQQYGFITCILGDVETSVKAARTAVELDPVSRSTHHILGHVLYFGRRYDEAIAIFRQLLEIDPDFPRPRYTLGMCLYMRGDAEAAYREVSREPLGWMRLSGSAILLHRLGRKTEAREQLEQLVREDDEEYAIYQQGQIYAQWDDPDRAIKCLHRARELGDPGVSQVLVDPLLDPVRDDPRFEGVLEATGYSRA